MLYAFGRCLARWLFILGFDVRVRRPLHAPPAGGFILASNHQSYFDPPLLGSCLRRPVSFMARDTLFRHPLFGGLIRGVGAFPVRRDGVGKERLKEAVRRLKAGAAVVVFVEGTRTRTGEIGEIRDGAGLLSRLAGVPVVPAALDGTYRAWPRGRSFPRPSRVRVAFGQPIPAERFRKDPEGGRLELETSIRSLHASLSKSQS